MGLLKKDLRKGDRVVISKSSSYYNKSSYNPPDSVQGTVQYDASGSVKWDNGTSNGYGDNDLVKVSDSTPRLEGAFREGARVPISNTSMHYNAGDSKPSSNLPDTTSSSKSTSTGLTKTPVIGKWYTNPFWSTGSMAKFRAIEGTEFGCSERMYPREPVLKVNSSWTLYEGVRLATESELRTLPKSHPDNPDYEGEKKSEYKPKTGDRVEIIADRAESGATIGSIGTVHTLYDDHCSIQMDKGRTYYNYFDDLTPEKKALDTLRGVSIGTYKPKLGDKVKIVANRSGSSNQIGDIGIVGNDHGTNCAVEVEGRSTGGNYHYYDDLEFISSKSSFNFKEGDKVKIINRTNSHGFTIGDTGILKGSKEIAAKGGYYWRVDGIERKVSSNSVRECDMELITSFKSATLDPITGHAKVWRVKTQKEMYDEGLIESPDGIPYGWNTKMIKYFGTTIDPKHYDEIESTTGSAAYQWCSIWWVMKNELTTKPLPLDNITMTSSDSGDDDEDEDDPNDGVSWFDSSEEEALDKLDEMSKGVAEKWFAETPEAWPGVKRPKTEVEVIPHRRRQIFK